MARKEGDAYIVNGSKFFITSAGEADVYFVLVRTDAEKGPQEMSALLIGKDTPGLSFGTPEDKMGLRSSSSREMFFDIGMALSRHRQGCIESLGDKK